MPARSPTSAPCSWAIVVALAFALAGCEKGCLSTWLLEHGVGSGGPSRPRSDTPGRGGSGPRGSGVRGAPVDLGGLDCSDGLARCVGGNVETSVAGHVPQPCTAPKELPGACACAWQSAGACATACVKEGLEVAATAEVAREQLCAPAVAILRPATAAEGSAVTICAEDGVSCSDGVLRVCTQRGQPTRVAGVCTTGCAAGIALDPGDIPTGDGAAAILCRRDHAERR